MRSSRKARTRYLRLLMKAQDGRCCYCARPMFIVGDISIKAFQQAHGLTYRVASKSRATLEHLKRQCDGGTHHPDNLAAACEQCNSKRQDRNWVEFKTLMSKTAQTNLAA
jgi:5-methylcytosine-specific restriction endonuclease McrA